MSHDHPEIAFVQASGYTRGRPDGPPLWIVIHDMEAHETPTTAEGTANYFATGAGGRQVSSHYCADSDSVVQCVHLGDVAWTVGNRPGNYRGINWELAGFASQSRDEWLDDFGRAMFAQMAPIVRSDAARFGIPLERRTVDELRAYVPGVTSHNDLRLAFGVTDHTDPGPNFPWDVFLATMIGDEMSVESEIDAFNASSLMFALATGAASAKCKYRWMGDGHQIGDEFQQTLQPFWDVVRGQSEPLTPEELAAVTEAARAGAEAGAPTASEIADAVVDEEHARLAE